MLHSFAPGDGGDAFCSLWVLWGCKGAEEWHEWQAIVKQRGMVGRGAITAPTMQSAALCCATVCNQMWTRERITLVQATLLVAPVLVVQVIFHCREPVSGEDAVLNISTHQF